MLTFARRCAPPAAPTAPPSDRARPRAISPAWPVLTPRARQRRRSRAGRTSSSAPTARSSPSARRLSEPWWRCHRRLHALTSAGPCRAAPGLGFQVSS